MFKPTQIVDFDTEMRNKVIANLEAQIEDEPQPEIQSNYSMLFTDDPKANYICGSKGHAEDLKVDENCIVKKEIIDNLNMIII